MLQDALAVALEHKSGRLMALTKPLCLKLTKPLTPMLQDALAVALEHKSGRLMAPLGAKRVAFFIDDLHLPPHDAYKAQPTLQLNL
jgi:hypothetical protein